MVTSHRTPLLKTVDCHATIPIAWVHPGVGMASSFHQLSVANVQNLIAWWKTLLPCINRPGVAPWPTAGWLKMQPESQIADCLFHFVAVHLCACPMYNKSHLGMLSGERVWLYLIVNKQSIRMEWHVSDMPSYHHTYQWGVPWAPEIGLTYLLKLEVQPA